MAREFTRNLFIMLVAIMVGVVIITFFAADIIKRSEIETMTSLHITEMGDLASRSENFTDCFLQGTLSIDTARETREVANYYFDFALFWFQEAFHDLGATEYRCIDNCTQAIDAYHNANEKFGKALPYFDTAQTFNPSDRYVEIIGYYRGFAVAGQNITLLRIEAADYLKRAAENLSKGAMDNVTALLENFTEAEEEYQGQLEVFDEYRGKIDGYLFFSEIREIP